MRLLVGNLIQRPRPSQVGGVRLSLDRLFSIQYGRRMAKSTKSSASTWRKLDAAYRKQQKERRDANKARRQSRLESADNDE